MRAAFTVTYVFSGFVVIYVLGSILKAGLFPDRQKHNTHRGTTGDVPESSKYVCCGSARCDSLLDALSKLPLGLLLFSMFWLIFMPIFYCACSISRPMQREHRSHTPHALCEAWCFPASIPP